MAELGRDEVVLLAAWASELFWVPQELVKLVNLVVLRLAQGLHLEAWPVELAPG